MLQLVIPAFNEEARLPRTLRELTRYATANRAVLGGIEVVVVDNASTDATSRVARDADCPALPVRVVHCADPGKGAAVRAGMAVTTADVVGFMDADGATRLDALDEGWRRILLGADIAIGSRAVPGSDTAVRHSRLRERGARAYRSCTARLVPGIVDTQCGFKLLRGDLARDVFSVLRTPGFSFDVELLARARRLGAVIDEFPVVWADVPGSTFDPVRHGAGSFVDLGRIAWQMRAARPATATVQVIAPRAVPSAVPPAAAGAEF
ncbi:glycosyltransferase [Nocardioides sp. dk4132]|uniref:dolichyl-phosphate beta-glucosyltransferase n=1 Tax=unclassified Nocardioides TaxID=2615069 RepID=UPI0012949108|nr:MULTISPECIES: dolichyl-phosphate beta-glucosyltransferase [unclassified Nocardioides]MQW76408.1 glycosyltransferase [Nocardioides sp. dk4132]QGA07318.1 glycosyltransferase [Nocardioides sp. dk884]